MKAIYLASFERDLKKIRKIAVKEELLETIKQIKACESMLDIKDLKKIKGGRKYYRVKIGDYRLGIKIEGETVIFVRFLHRKDIYKYFP